MRGRGRANEKTLAAEVSSLRTAVDDEKERADQLDSAQEEVGEAMADEATGTTVHEARDLI